MDFIGTNEYLKRVALIDNLFQTTHCTQCEIPNTLCQINSHDKAVGQDFNLQFVRIVHYHRHVFVVLYATGINPEN